MDRGRICFHRPLPRPFPLVEEEGFSSPPRTSRKAQTVPNCTVPKTNSPDYAVRPFQNMEEPASPRTRPSTPPGTSGPSRPTTHRRVVQHSSSEIDGAEEEFDVPQLERQKSKLASGGARTVSSMVVWLLGRFGCAPGSGTLIGMAIYAVVLYCFLLVAAHVSFATLSLIFSHKVHAQSAAVPHRRKRCLGTSIQRGIFSHCKSLTLTPHGRSGRS